MAQSVHPDLPLPGAAGPHLVALPRHEGDHEGVLVLLARAHRRPLHPLAGAALAAPVLQQVVLQHPGPGVQHEPAVLPALHHVGELAQLPLPPPGVVRVGRGHALASSDHIHHGGINDQYQRIKDQCPFYFLSQGARAENRKHLKPQ